MKPDTRHPALAMLEPVRWDQAFHWLLGQSRAILGEKHAERLFAVRENRREVQAEICESVEGLYARGSIECGSYALAWGMLTVNPQVPATFRTVLPQLQHALDEAELPAED